MSTEKAHRKTLRVLAVAAAVLITSEAVSQDGRDPVLDFYCERAAAVAEARDPLARGARYSFVARTYVKHTTAEGVVRKTDSAIVRYYYSFGNCDSMTVIGGNIRKPDSLPLPPPNVFAEAYLFNFFPNDTGGSHLAIGFDTPTDSTASPVGLAVVDRDRYFLSRLYLFFPNDPDFKRHTRSYRMIERDGLVFVDSIWEVIAKAGIFSAQNYRIETGIDSLNITR